jgi:hypothetical protein
MDTKMAAPAVFQIGQRIRIIAREDHLPDHSTGTVMATLTISPGYYDVYLDRKAIRCIMCAADLAALPMEHSEPA